ncbi:spore germination protein KB [Paenibacillus sp. UNC496MF]|uniref:GerAB/ArcD/ProY family transporter n=1 Tax=Paenibacillus sp. UNC496MF TaxID=1502753 RepID=UPI0008EC0A6F|nr:endospore germination permease [Paenibacillus sp. UNC496MF]SFJ58191.1 spore germination protein KB [Paenibacillus sp. UNC496MF]
MKSYGYNDRISNMELFALMFVFVVGSLLTIPVGFAAGHDAWISVLIGTLVGLAINGLYVYLCHRYPHKSLVEIAHVLLGSWIGKLVGLLYAWYGFYLGCYVLRSFTDMTAAVLLPRTPTVVLGTVMITLTVWTATKGIEVVSRCSLMILVLIFVSTFIGCVLLIPDMEPANMLPILDNGWPSVLWGAGQIATVPLGETIVFAMLIPYVNRTSTVRRTVICAIGACGILLFITCFVNIFVLGEIASAQLFPSYTSFMYIAVGDFFERIEPLVFTVWIFNEFTKLSVCLLSTSIAFAQTIRSRDYRIYVLPLGLMILLLSTFLHPNQLDLVEYVKKIWPIYSIPFLIVVPVLLLVVSLFRGRGSRARLTEAEPDGIETS